MLAMRPKFPVVKSVRRAIARIGSSITVDIKGATAVEYGLILAVLVVAMLVGFTTLADGTTSIWNMVDAKVANAR